MLKSQLESYIHKLLVKVWHGQRLEPVNMSRDRTEGFGQMSRHMAGFVVVVVGSTEPYLRQALMEERELLKEQLQRSVWEALDMDATYST
jgi:hypothetical protein